MAVADPLLPSSQPWGRVAVAIVTAVVTVVGYLGLLGWDQHKTTGPDGYLHGPYQGWQVIALVLVLAALAGWVGWCAQIWSGALAATATVMLCFAIDSATDVDSDGLWPIGAALAGATTLGGFLVVGSLVRWLRRKSAQTGGP